MNSLSVPAYAKINLSLDVLGQRPDGYHDVRMVMQSLKLHDLLHLERLSSPEIVLQTCHDTSPDIRWDSSNLIYRAAEAFLRRYSIPDGVRITVEKNIPSAAGLAGGSSDAAATLKGLNTLFDCAAPLSDLQQLGLSLGADVPYCLLLGTALSEGIGELLTPLPPAPELSCVLVKPAQAVSTRYVYQQLRLTDKTRHPDTSGILHALQEQDAAALCSRLENVLEPIAVTLCPEIPELKQQLLSFGALGACMSGSGPTVFGLFSDAAAAAQAADFFCHNGYAGAAFCTRLHTPL